MPLALVLLLPLGGFWLLIAAPSADVHWEDHPSHFWLVLAASITSLALAYATGTAAQRRQDARLCLVALAFLSAAGFLGLHALATPGVLLDKPNEGFVIATPIGLLVASAFAAASAVRFDVERARSVVARYGALRAGLIGVMVVWGVLSLASVAPLDDPHPAERASGGLIVPAAAAVLLYAFASYRYLRMWRVTRAPLPLATASAFVLLGEAMVAVAFARNWHASWWEWHLLMLTAFGLIAWSVHREEAEERFSDLYLDDTAAGKREISVMFADLEGYTAFSERHDPRDVSEMLNAYFGVAIPAVVKEHGGEIDRLIGDALMATFNTHGDQPDHAQRAARAALALQRDTTELADSHPDWPRFRVGVNSGEALVGVVGVERGRSYTVIGDPVNLAARIEGQAPVGGVAIGAATLQSLEAARVRPLGPLQIKGRSRPVEAYVLDALDPS
jgi:adenylate cyclase